MRRFLLAGLFLLPFLADAQRDTAHWTLPGAFDRFTTDDLGNLYTLRGNDLDLYDRSGRPLAHNSFKTFGAIDRIDAFSSLKPLIFSRSQGQLALLDNTLSVQGAVIDLQSAGFPAVTLTCMSVQSCFWFFDERDGALLRVDGQLRPIARSGRLDQVLGMLPHPVYMEETDDRLYVVDPDNGVFVFDLFGTPLRTLPIKGARQVQVRDGAVWHVSQGRLLKYDLLTLLTEEVPWPTTAADTATAPTVQEARIAHGRIYRSTKDGIRVDALP